MYGILNFLTLCLGVMVVLLLQGYPLAGITIAGLGGVMCCGSITVLVICFIRRKSGEVRNTEEQEIKVQEVPEHA